SLPQQVFRTASGGARVITTAMPFAEGLGGMRTAIVSAATKGTPATGSRPQFLFRGTSVGYPGGPSVQKVGVTPVSTDPGKATLFAIESSQYGEGVLIIARSSDLPAGSIGAGNVLGALESEVGVSMLPVEFARRARMSLTVEQARTLLQQVGVETPVMLATKAQLDAALRTAPAMTQQQIETFLRGALRFQKAPVPPGGKKP
ncbi:MAG: hypothetical protein N3A38_17150, partial [Planctomycetota bacterium]|nr:hypothetical protein [Planctomycetota bacterium]